MLAEKKLQGLRKMPELLMADLANEECTSLKPNCLQLCSLARGLPSQLVNLQMSSPLDGSTEVPADRVHSGARSYGLDKLTAIFETSAPRAVLFTEL